MEPTGYAYLRRGGKGSPKLTVHRAAFELAHGPIPEGMQVDHTCHNAALALDLCVRGPCPHRRCCNPRHLEATSPGANTRRAGRATIKRCPKGHAYTPENTYLWRGKRHCRTCVRDRAREYQRRLRA